MNSKHLAEMIKCLRKQRLNEYQVRAGGTNPLQSKKPNARAAVTDQKNQPKGGNDVQHRYKPSGPVEEEKTDSKKKTTIINTTPEYNSLMVGTQ